LQIHQDASQRYVRLKALIIHLLIQKEFFSLIGVLTEFLGSVCTLAGVIGACSTLRWDRVVGYSLIGV